MSNHFISRQQACDSLGISLSTFSRLVKKGISPFDSLHIVHLGRRILVKSTLLDDLVTMPPEQGKSFLVENCIEEVGGAESVN